MSRNNKNKSAKTQRGAFDWFTETSIYAMRKGQFGTNATFVVIIIMLLKSSQERIDKLWDELISLSGLSFLLNILLICAFYKYSKHIRSKASHEQRRVGREKSKWQEKVVGHKLGSSD